MKKLMSMIMVLLLAGLTAFGQQSGKERKAAAEKKAAAERQRSVGGIRTENELKDDKGEVPANQRAGQEAREGQTQEPSSEVAPSNKDQQDATTEGGGAQDQTQGASANDGDNAGNTTAEQKSNAPAIIQRTTSESGSPSVLSDNNGRGRDGTNNVQRSTINMAGAEVPADMGLSRKSGSQRNMNTGAATKIREQEEQPQRAISKKEQARNKQQVEAQQRNDEAKNKQDEQDDNKKKNRSRKNRKNKDS